MEHDIRKSKRRLLGILGALWLIIGCLGGCEAMPQSGQAGTGAAPTTGTEQAAETSQVLTIPGSMDEERETEPDIIDKGQPSDWSSSDREQKPEESVDEWGSYTGRDEVALYLHLYGHLPSNYITKREAEELGWNSKSGNLWEVAPGMSIGGSRFGNYEGALPDKKGRKYYECDIDFEGGYRGAKRIIYSDDGLIFYTEDHYKTFVQLYGQ